MTDKEFKDFDIENWFDELYAEIMDTVNEQESIFSLKIRKAISDMVEDAMSAVEEKYYGAKGNS